MRPSSSSVYPISSSDPYVLPPARVHRPCAHTLLHQVIEELSEPGVLTKGARALSAIKGIEVDVKTIDIYTYPSIIESKLGLPCSALGGANIALEVANKEFCETT
jgi:glycerol-3-phosphate dehydrogenase (NAD+)